MLEKLRFPKELGRCRGITLIFLDTNVLVDAEDFVEQIFQKSEVFSGVICDFIEGEVRNLRKVEVLDALQSGYLFETEYNSREGSARSLKDMPTEEIAETVLTQYDKKLDPSGMTGIAKGAKSSARSKSRFVDFSLLTVAAVAAYRRKRQSVIISRDRWMKLSCKALEEKHRLLIYCYDQWNFSLDEIVKKAQKS